MARRRKLDDEATERARAALPPAGRVAPRRGPLGRLRRLLLGAALAMILLVVGLAALLNVADPPTTPYMASEARRLGGVERDWVDLDAVAPVMARAVVAAEDAGFCAHWGLDVRAIREALAEGGARGASTISQQVAKNVFLWQGRSWLRKALEAGLTPVLEAVLSKRRILEIYLNVAEFGEGTFGVEAAARRYFGVAAAELSGTEAARLAAVLPDPKGRDPTNLSPALRERAARILDGAETIRRDGRDACLGLPD